MGVFETAVTIVAIVFGYKLLSDIVSVRKETKIKRYQARGGVHEQVATYEDPGELQGRADDLKRRLATLEEIIASERRS